MRARRRHVRRLAAFAIVGVGSLALTGCHEILRVTLGGDDPPVHPPPAGRATDLGTAAAGRAFSGRADGQLASRIVLRHGFVKSTIRNARFIGEFSGRLLGAQTPGDAALGLLGKAQWHGNFSSTRNRATRKITTRGLILATFEDATAGRACMRVGYRNAGRTKRTRSRNKGSSSLAVLGGEGGARTLRGTATVRITIARSGAMRLRGRVKTSRGAERGLPRACRKLEKKFGLQPLAG
jgi:hypothetical protein